MKSKNKKNGINKVLVHPKSNPFRAILFSVIGLIVGAGLMYFYEKQKGGTAIAADNRSIESVLPKQVKVQNLTNPVLEEPTFKTYNTIKLKGISEKLEQNIASLIAEKKVNAVSIYFRDLTNDDWFGINETETFSPASLMKVPVMIAVLKLLENQNSLLKKELTFGDRRENYYVADRELPFNTKTALIPDRGYTIDRLLEIMIMESDNEATIMLLDFLNAQKPGFLKKVQEDLGIHVPTSAKNSESFISVKSYSTFFRTLYNSSYLTPEMSEKALAILTRTGYGYGIRLAVPKNVIVSQKFGFKKISKDEKQLHQFGLVYHAKKPFLIGIMTKGPNMVDLQKVIESNTAVIYAEIDLQTQRDTRNLERDIE